LLARVAKKLRLGLRIDAIRSQLTRICVDRPLATGDDGTRWVGAGGVLL
jgi:hypothetical protein